MNNLIVSVNKQSRSVNSPKTYIGTDGWVVLWTNNKYTTNNYQVRVNTTYLIS